MRSNAPPNLPPQPLTGKRYERFRRWYNAHVLHRWPGSRRQRVVRYAKGSLHYSGRMIYSMKGDRSVLFHRRRGRFAGAHADCSQFAAAIFHWAGVRSVTASDWTGTLGQKGRAVRTPKRGDLVLFGTAPYVHCAIMVDGTHCVGFGSSAAPDERTVAAVVAYFASRGIYGHTFRDLIG